MRRRATAIVAAMALTLSQPGPARAQGLEELLAFYAQGAGNGFAYITQGLIYNVGQLTNLAPAATQGAMASGATVAAGIAEVLQYDPSIRNALAHRAYYYGAELGLRGEAFLEAMREAALLGDIGTAAHSPFPSVAGRSARAGAASAEALVAVAGLAVVAGITAYTIHELYLAYQAELDAAGAEADAYANTVRLMVERLADGRHALCPGVDIPQALRAIRFNADAGRFPYLGVLEDCAAPATDDAGPAWRLASIAPNPGNGPLSHATDRITRSCTPPPARDLTGAGGGGAASARAATFFLIDHRRRTQIAETVNVTFALRADLPRSVPPGEVAEIGLELQVSGTHDSENAAATAAVTGYRGALNVMSCALVGCGTAAPVQSGTSAVRFPGAADGGTFEVSVQLSDGAGSPVGSNCRAVYRYAFDPG